MSKTANRKAAKAYADEVRRQRAEEAHQAAVKVDVAQLREMKRYFIFRQHAKVCAADLIAAMEAHAEKLTGDPRALSTPHHSIPH